MRRVHILLLATCLTGLVPVRPVAHPYEPLACTAGAPTLEVVSYTPPGTTQTRSIEIGIVEPTGLPPEATLPLPTVIWSHGGASGGTPQTMAEWRTATAEACYVSVSIGHAWPDPQIEADICTNLLQLTAGVDCGVGLYKLLNLLRPYDIAAAIDHLETTHAALVDAARIAVGGHSAGAGGALMVAGATRAYRTGDAAENYFDIRDLSDPRPVAFLAFSPQGPGVDGFYESWKFGGDTAWQGVARPVLIGTGDGDNGCDEAGPPTQTSSTIHYCTAGPTPSNRAAVFDLLPSDPGGTITKYRLYIDDWRAAHTIFKLARSTCASGGGPTPDNLCDLMHEGLRRAAIAFLDWHLRADPDAEYFLGLDANIPGSRGRFVWDLK